MENEEMSKADLIAMLVSIREVARTNGEIHTVEQFPSPVGELHFSIPSLQSRHQSGLMVGIAWEKYFWKNK